MKILITHPDFLDPGGVAGYFKNLKNKFNLSVNHFFIGKRPHEKGILRKGYRLIHDYYHFLKCVKNDQYDIIHLNPSLDLKSIVRDGIFILIGKIFRKKIVVFFHGWTQSYESAIDRWLLVLFKSFYGRTDALIVLAEKFKDKIESWGLNQQRIYIESTCIDDDALEGFDIKKALIKKQEPDKWRILFLSRIIKEKGIYETIKSVSLLHAQYPEVELIIAGEGDELVNVKSFVNKHKIPNISFIGYVKGKEKYELLSKVHILCFPTFHGEGMPVAVVEAMAFGLPIITRPVGGIADFFKNYENGFCSYSKQPEVFSDFIERLILDEQLYKKISLNNYMYSQLKFLSSQSALRLEKIYKTLLTV